VCNNENKGFAKLFAEPVEPLLEMTQFSNCGISSMVLRAPAVANPLFHLLHHSSVFRML